VPDSSESVGNEEPLTLTQFRFWRQYLTTMRPYLFPVSGLAGLAGMSLAKVADPWRWGMAMAVFTLAYGFGQALTDCFQQDTDRLSASYRPLIRGTISARQVLLVSLSGLVTGMAILAWCNVWNLAVSAFAVVGLLAYTPLKRRWWAGPLANASVVALLPVMGWLVRPGNHPAMLLQHPEVLAVALMSFAAYANFVLVGYLKDIDADRQTRYETLPVVFGWRRAAIVSDIWSAGALAAGIWAVSLLAKIVPGSILPAGAVVLLAAVLSVTAQVTLHRINRQEQAYRPILNVVRVFLLLHVAVVILANPRWSAVAVVLFFGFEFLAILRPERRQV